MITFKQFIKENENNYDDLKSEFEKYNQHLCNNSSTGYYKRDNCGVAAADFYSFLNKKGIKNHDRISGTFTVDNPTYKKQDFTKEELIDMKNKNYDPNNEDHRKQYAKENNLIDELKKVPHYWNTINGKIVDVTGYHQFVKTGMAKDTNPNRYIPD